MSVRAYDPALGRFLSRDPLGRAPLFFSDQPYVYGGNNPLINVDPSGQYMADIAPAKAHAMMKKRAARIHTRPWHWPGCKGTYSQCNHWRGAMSSAKSGYENNENAAFVIFSVVNLIIDLADLMADKGKSLLLTIIDGVSLAGNILYGLNYLMRWIQGAFHIDTSGIRVVIGVSPKSETAS